MAGHPTAAVVTNTTAYPYIFLKMMLLQGTIAVTIPAFLLLMCLCVAFDPPFSPRQLGRRLGLPLPFLPLTTSVR